MKILAFETSTLLASVALLVDGEVVAEESSLRQRTHSEVINVFAENCLKKAQLQLQEIDVFATGQGPGSFTGIRVAANAAKTFSYVQKKPLVTIDSLVLLAAPVKPQTQPVLAIINAYKNMVYTGLFDVSGDFPRYLLGPLALPVIELAGKIDQDVLVVGDGFTDYQAYFPADLKAKLQRDEGLADYPHARTLALKAEKMVRAGQTIDWKNFHPLYIRASEAEESQRGIFIKPLM